MQKLRGVIEQHSKWKDYLDYVDRIEGFVETDFSHSLENAKSLIESIAKEVCVQRNVEVERTASIDSVLKKAFAALNYNGDHLVTQISTSLGNIGRKFGELRNVIGITSHGMAAEELRTRNEKVDLFTRELLVDTTEIVAVLMIRCFEAEFPSVINIATHATFPDYDDNQAFNEFWDEGFGEFVMGDYTFLSSEILYGIDPTAYQSELNAYNLSKDVE